MMRAEPPSLSSRIQPEGHYLNFRRSPRRDRSDVAQGGKVDALSEMARESAIVVSLALADGPSGTFQAFCPPT
jgi:hypothetical protein